jgi:hypothetical protein
VGGVLVDISGIEIADTPLPTRGSVDRIQARGGGPGKCQVG